MRLSGLDRHGEERLPRLDQQIDFVARSVAPEEERRRTGMVQIGLRELRSDLWS